MKRKLLLSAAASGMLLLMANITLAQSIPDFYGEKGSKAHLYWENKGQLLQTDMKPAKEVFYYTEKTSPAVYLGLSRISYVFSKIDQDSATLDSTHRVDMRLEAEIPPVRVDEEEACTSKLNYYGRRSYEEIGGCHRLIYRDVYPFTDLHVYSNANGLKYYFVIRPGGDPSKIIMNHTGQTHCECKITGEYEIETTLGKLVFDQPNAYQLNPGNQIKQLPWRPEYQDFGGGRVGFTTGPYNTKQTLVIQMDQGKERQRAGVEDRPIYGSYLGGSGTDVTNDAVTDKNGNLYLIGETQSQNFPTSIGAEQEFYRLGYEAFIFKLDNSYGRAWATYIGADGDEMGHAVAYSDFGGVEKLYVTGAGGSGVGFVSNGSAYLQEQSGTGSGFLGYLVPDDGVLDWFTHLGESFILPTALGTDETTGDLFVAGHVMGGSDEWKSCNSPYLIPGFPLCNRSGTGYFQDIHSNDSANYTSFDAFLMRFNLNDVLMYSSYIGGSGNDYATGVVADNSSGQVVVTGVTNSPNQNEGDFCTLLTGDGSFPICYNGTAAFWQASHNGFNVNDPTNNDGFFMQLDMDDMNLNYSSYFGGEGDDGITDVAMNSGAEVAITGYTSTDYIDLSYNCSNHLGQEFPVCTTSVSHFQPHGGGTYDNFLAAFDREMDILYSGFVGGEEEEAQGGLGAWSGNRKLAGNPAISIDADDNIFIGSTAFRPSGSMNDNIPLTSAYGYYNQQNNADLYNQFGTSISDGFVTGFSADYSLAWGSYWGGTGQGFDVNSVSIGDAVTAIATYSNDRVFISGATYSNDNFPLNRTTVSAWWQDTCRGCAYGNSDTYIAQLNEENIPLTSEEVEEIHGQTGIYPNPANGYTHIETDMEGKLKISIFDLTGKRIRNAYSGSGKIRIDTEELPAGIYLIKIASREQEENYKLIKQ